MGKKLEVKINEQKAIELSQRLFQMMDEKVPPFNRKDVFPDSIVPEGLEPIGLEHRLFLFYSGSIDGRTSSPNVYSELRDLHSGAGVVQLQSSSLEDLRGLLLKHLPKTLGVSKDSQRLDVISLAIYYNSLILCNKYQGDPENIFVPDSVDQTHERLCEFKGIGRHKAALIMKNYVRFGVWPFSEYEIPMKIDRHTFRILYGTGVLEITREGKPLEESERVSTKSSFDEAQAQLQDITLRNRISALRFNDGLWSLGSRFCRRNDYIFCQVNCNVGCYYRPDTPEGVSYVVVGSDTRKNRGKKTLFNCF